MSFDVLKGNSYPGRGIAIGKTEDGKNAVLAYFIMGRSENSRNRIFVEENGTIRTEAFDPSKLSDPSLIIYNAIRSFGNETIVTNGDQTDTVYDFISEGKTFEEALRTREFEPDSPNFTPRISGILDVSENSFTYKLSILKSHNGDSSSCVRNFYEYAQPISGTGHIIHTYECDGNPIPSFKGEPKVIPIGNDIDEIAEDLWTTLDADNKVSLAVRFISLTDGTEKTRIINKNK